MENTKVMTTVCSTDVWEMHVKLRIHCTCDAKECHTVTSGIRNECLVLKRKTEQEKRGRNNRYKKDKIEFRSTKSNKDNSNKLMSKV
jgi:hypothetical protein